MVSQIGVTTRKAPATPDILLIVSLYSEDDPATHKPYYDQLYLSNYAFIYCADEIKRIDGVGDGSSLFGEQDYSMRVWIDPDQLAARGLTAMERRRRRQGAEHLPGGGGPSSAEAALQRQTATYQFTLTTLGRLVKPEQFENIIIRTTPDGRMIRIKDVGYADDRL